MLSLGERPPQSTQGDDRNQDLLGIIDALCNLVAPDSAQHAWIRIQLLTRAENLLAAAKLEHVKALRALERELPHGDDSAVDWLAGGLHLRRDAAYAQVRTAAELDEFPGLASAVRRGELSPQATTAIIQTLRRFRSHAPDHLDRIEFEMLAAAREMDHEELRRHGSKLFHILDPRAARQVQDGERERRYFDLRRRGDGWFDCAGALDPVDGTFLQIALRATAGKHQKDDGRTPAQVRADALSELAQHRLAFPDLPEHGQEKPHLTIVVNAETLRGEPGSPPATIDWGTPVCGETAKRLACDAIARLAVVGDRGDGVVDVLHMGRAFRTTSVAERRALELQDGGCLWPGCGRHHKDATPHHWEAWAAGGRTDHENLGLVCPRHHYNLHEGGFRVAEVAPDHVAILWPDGTEFATVARHRWRRVRITDPEIADSS